jgi:hypothetical protein
MIRYPVWTKLSHRSKISKRPKRWGTPPFFGISIERVFRAELRPRTPAIATGTRLQKNNAPRRTLLRRALSWKDRWLNGLIGKLPGRLQTAYRMH